MSEAPLSVEAAIGLLDTPAVEPDEAPAVEAELNESEAEPTAEEADAPEEVSEGEETEQEDPEAPAIPAPKSWDAEARAAFAQLPRAAQEKIAAREDERDRAVSKAQQEAGDAKRRAEEEASTIGQYKAQLDQLIPNAQKVFADKWANLTPENIPTLRAQYGSDQVEAWKDQRDLEYAELSRLTAAQQQAAKAEHAQFLAQESAKLAELAPDLVDPKTGDSKRAALMSYLMSRGASPEQLIGLNAEAIALFYDGMRYRQTKASLKAPIAIPAKPGLRPAAAQPVPSKTRTAQAVSERFARTGSVDDAIAMLNARSG